MAAETTPMQGFSMEALQLFCRDYKDKINDGMTTIDICEKIVKPETESDNCSMVDWWVKRKDGINRKLVGRATIFISHVWKYKFNQLVGLIEKYWRENGQTQNMFFWYDCFVVNQHIRTVVPYETLKTLFGQSLKNIGKCLVALIDWKKPEYISRCWCLFEMNTMLSQKIDHDIRMTEDDEKSFINQLEKDEQFNFFEGFENIKSEKANATQIDDEKNIKKTISDTIGFHTVDARVYSALREWFAQTGVRYLEGKVNKDEKYWIATHNVADLLDDVGYQMKALPMFKSCLAWKSKHLGEKNLSTIWTMNRLGWCLLGLGEFDFENCYFEKCISVLVSQNKTPNTMANLASCYLATGKNVEALDMFTQLHGFMVKKYGKDDPKTLFAVHNIASCHLNLDHFSEAAKLFKQCLDSRKLKLGSDHPDTIFSQFKLAVCLMKMGNVNEAKPLYEECTNSNSKLFGTGVNATTLWRVASKPPKY